MSNTEIPGSVSPQFSAPRLREWPSSTVVPSSILVIYQMLVFHIPASWLVFQIPEMPLCGVRYRSEGPLSHAMPSHWGENMERLGQNYWVWPWSLLLCCLTWEKITGDLGFPFLLLLTSTQMQSMSFQEQTMVCFIFLPIVNRCSLLIMQKAQQRSFHLKLHRVETSAHLSQWLADCSPGSPVWSVPEDGRMRRFQGRSVEAPREMHIDQDSGCIPLLTNTHMVRIVWVKGWLGVLLRSPGSVRLSSTLLSPLGGSWPRIHLFSSSVELIQIQVCLSLACFPHSSSLSSLPDCRQTLGYMTHLNRFS